jgi:hypothetical protein
MKATSMIEVCVVGLGMAPRALLKERDGERVLPVGIGPSKPRQSLCPCRAFGRLDP